LKVTIAAIGRMKSGPEADLLDTYLTRARQQGRQAGLSAVSVTEFAESRKPDVTARKAEEAHAMLGACPPGATIVALDERGQTLTSQQFADTLRRELDAGTTDLVFCIGGPDGHGDALHTAARLTVSFGRMSWPHKLARAMLGEQIYRAVTILVNHPYHRE
jgi:23S rRNA (pseudouridine1915-N3)-methyltransferase